MNIAQSVKTGLFALIFFNLIMALSSIWIFMRMSPAIENILSKNERTLKSCEEMLIALSLVSQDRIKNQKLIKNFENSLKMADLNITEKKEPEVLKRIKRNYKKAFKGFYNEKEKTIFALENLAEINRKAMASADSKAKKFGSAGAWMIVFMASALFFTGLLLKRIIKNHLLKPLYEIHSVISENLKNITLRRCTGHDLPPDIRAIYNEINQYIDRHQNQVNDYYE